MAKIENTTAYPTVTPAADDLLIGTDVNNDNQTVTFTVSDIVGAGGVAQGLQSVLDTNNIATQNIDLTGNITVIGTIYPTTITALGTTGNNNQILSSTGGGLLWIDQPTVTCCSLNDVLTSSVGANIATTAMILDGVALTVQNAGGSIDITTPATLTNSGTSTFTNTVNINGAALNFDGTGQINDSNGTIGTAGYFLTSEGPGQGVAWSNTLPTGADPTLQEVLTAGNIADGVGITFQGTSTTVFGSNNDISSSGTNTWNGNNTFTATGNLVTTAGLVFSPLATLWAGNPGSIGTSGQVLSATGTGVKWATLVIPPDTLQEVLDAGNTAAGANANITIEGFMKPGTIQDSAGAVGGGGQVLTSTGAGLSWAAAGTGAVTSVSLAGASGVSTGANDALTITPTTGAVVVTTNAFDGGAKVGHVPSSAAVAPTTHFLRADGSWQAPISNAPHGVQNFKFFSNFQSYSGVTYYTLLKSTSLVGQSSYIPNTITTVINPLAALSYAEETGATFFVNPGEGINCSTGYPNLVMCNARIQISSNYVNTYKVQFWKIQQCAGVAPTLAGTIDIPVGAASMACADMLFSSLALRTLEPGYGYLITVYMGTPYASGLGFVVNVSLRW